MKPFPMEPGEVWPAVAVLLTLGAAVVLASLIERRRERRRMRARLRGFLSRSRQRRWDDGL